jgi:hypothetical protein
LTIAESEIDEGLERLRKWSRSQTPKIGLT